MAVYINTLIGGNITVGSGGGGSTIVITPQTRFHIEGNDINWTSEEGYWNQGMGRWEWWGPMSEGDQGKVSSIDGVQTESNVPQTGFYLSEFGDIIPEEIDAGAGSSFKFDASDLPLTTYGVTISVV